MSEPIKFDVCPDCGSHCGFTETYSSPKINRGREVGKRYCALCGCKKPMQIIYEAISP